VNTSNQGTSVDVDMEGTSRFNDPPALILGEYVFTGMVPKRQVRSTFDRIPIDSLTPQQATVKALREWARDKYGYTTKDGWVESFFRNTLLLLSIPSTGSHELVVYSYRSIDDERMEDLTVEILELVGAPPDSWEDRARRTVELFLEEKGSTLSSMEYHEFLGGVVVKY